MTTLYDLDAVTVDGYRVHTGDLTTNGVTVSGALVEAEEILAEFLRRDLALEERTEQCRVYPDGRIYPRAWPITASADLTIDGRALLGATSDLPTFVAWFPDSVPTKATVTYTGGFDDGTNGTRLPVTLRHALYDLAHAVAQDRPAVPVGATAASVGDVSVSFATPSSGSVEALVPGLSTRVRRYRNRWA